MTEDEIMNEINICRNVLEQYDYTARKVAFEVAEVIKKMYPDVEMPYYDKYKETEEQAKELREKINELEEQLEE